MKSFDQLVEHYPVEVFVKGQTLLLKNDVPRAVYSIESGLVKAYMITSDGNERLVGIHTKGEDIPIGYAVSLTDVSEYFYEAYTKCRIRLIPRPVFERQLRADPDALYHWLVRSELLLMETFSRVNALEQPRASDKIAFTLFYMANLLGVRQRPYKTRRKLLITQQEIADALGITRETTSAELKKLELKQIISHSRKSYVLSMERLKKYLDRRS